MKFLIVGDSWGCGEWNADCTFNPHRGLEQYLTEDGHRVTNLSDKGISNHDIYQRIESYVRRNTEHNINGVFVFQTEYTRDHKHSDGWENSLNANDWPEITEPEDLAIRWMSRFYRNLSDISQKSNCKIYIIGGASDTMWLDDMDAHYPGCEIVCQSMTNLLVNNNHRVEQPVFSVYEQRSEEVVKKIKSKLVGNDRQERLLEMIDQGYRREFLWREHPNWFYPDGVHPNRQGIRVLYDFLKVTCLNAN